MIINSHGPIEEKGEANTKERLDQAVANEAWKTRFSNTTVSHIISRASDHIPSTLRPHKNANMEVDEILNLKNLGYYGMIVSLSSKKLVKKELAIPRPWGQFKKKIAKCGLDLLA